MKQIKDLVSLQWLRSLLWSRFHPWPRNFHVLQMWQKKKKKKKVNEKIKKKKKKKKEPPKKK